MKRVLSLLVVLLFGGVGYWLGYRETPTQPPTMLLQPIETEDVSACAECTLLRSECDALRAQLVSAVEPSEPMTETLGEGPKTPPTFDSVAIDPAWEARVREEHEAAMEAQRKYHSERMTFLQDVDLSLLTPAEQRIHSDYQTALEEVYALQMSINESGANEEHLLYDLGRELFHKRMHLQELREAEYSTLVSAVGASMGLSREDSIAFTQLIREINSHLEMGGPQISVMIHEEEK